MNIRIMILTLVLLLIYLTPVQAKGVQFINLSKAVEDSCVIVRGHATKLGESSYRHQATGEEIVMDEVGVLNISAVQYVGESATFKIFFNY